MDPLIRTARVTGLLYLGLAVSGALGFLLIRSRLYAPDDAAATLANVVAHQSLARAGIAFELLTVLTQALVAVWFYRLFHAADRFAAGGIAAFGLANAIAVLSSAALLATALDAALDGEAGTVQLLYGISDNLWGVGALFFGLWLIPMGQVALRSGWLPRALGWLLIAGGIGYVLSAFLRYLTPDAQPIADLLAFPATAGEFWMIGYLLVRGVRRQATEHTSAPLEQVAA
ncbi:hypothetical protein Ais01nite_17890 [Asanoa ishikariensis]|uniref:DUF4386 domain-containing protein n=1 Tax=Asanoa ishikariensis TaxID=137265 RepID=A0A1H3UDX9_9ACTN|nr:DUF4386 domain-containing protein [Asanoa ishikariensis]GIF63754.1 hypothetical protein Ais01nite_17890 [Asanoa ishikariensis]SDZ60662.1 protein of unknown function [Asanoa ishikariensis]